MSNLTYLSESSSIRHDVDDNVRLPFDESPDAKYQNTYAGSSKQLDIRQRRVTTDPDFT